MESRVKFISYDGKYPNLCRGILTVEIEGKIISIPRYSCSSGGSVTWDEQWNFYIERGPWTVNVPDQYADYKEEIEECMNANVKWGCCGGCE